MALIDDVKKLIADFSAMVSGDGFTFLSVVQLMSDIQTLVGDVTLTFRDRDTANAELSAAVLTVMPTLLQVVPDKYDTIVQSMILGAVSGIVNGAFTSKLK